ncbi:MAG TPA: hypothetical protein VFY73_27675 [Ideonella sp.]|uniref:hypothetical protein n=1 Tax=Ideonella sp. TaxID=1929293 RepID=UPI002E2F7646|nr:hypothetical protein [Ideonella sp.]HEX5687812.1 hypothetical protein [Ideonella sp.]
MRSSNDDHFDPRTQLASLSAEEAVEYAQGLIDQHCEEKDAKYLFEVISAGERSVEVSYMHAVGGSAVAQLAYGLAKLDGEHTDQNVSEGLFWLVRSHNNGNASAAVMLWNAYTQGTHLPRSLGKAFVYASAAADRGLPAGQYILANVLVDSASSEDHERAIDLLRAAARNGHEPAVKMLADNGISLE